MEYTREVISAVKANAFISALAEKVASGKWESETHYTLGLTDESMVFAVTTFEKWVWENKNNYKHVEVDLYAKYISIQITRNINGKWAFVERHYDIVH